MTTCSKCAFWNPEGAFHHDRPGYGICDMLEQYLEHPQSNTLPALLEVQADDDSGLSISLRTKPYFGCTMFKQKEVNNG